jgi:transposase
VLSLPTTVRIFAAAEPVDLRKGFDALACLVRQVMVDDPLSGHLFVFVNRRGDRIKVLFWTRNGYCVLYKRIERGRVHLPTRTRQGESIVLEAAELIALLDGIDLRNATLKPAWARTRAHESHRSA